MGAEVSSYAVTVCDQCKRETVGNMPGWQRLQIHNMITGSVYTLDLCPDCYRSATLPVLMAPPKQVTA